MTRVVNPSLCSTPMISRTHAESLDAAEALMQKHKIRRIPVVDADRRPVGIVSMNDLARHAHRGGHHHDGLSPESIARTLAAVCQPSATRAHAAE